MKIAELENRLSTSFLNDARKRSRRTVTLEEGGWVVTVRVSGMTIGLAYALEAVTGERDALARVIERLDPDETVLR